VSLNNIGFIVKWVKLQLGKNTQWKYTWFHVVTRNTMFHMLETPVTLVGTPSSSITLYSTFR
jgi:hypothetical protein